jgi:hypothetical protein
MALRAQRIRIFANRQTKRVRIDVLTDDVPHLLKPSNLQVEVALMDDDGETLSTDIDDLDQITLTVKATQDDDAPILMQKTVAAADLNLALTLNEWNAGTPTACHALFEFTSEETNLDLAGEKEVTWYWVLSGLSISTPVKELAIANGSIRIEESGVNDEAPPDITEDGFYTKEQSDARYLLAANNTAVFFTNGDPLGFVTAQRPAMAYDAAGNFWLKTNSGSNATGWEQRLGSPVATATTYEFVSPGTEQLSFITGNPNGAVTATRPALAYDAAGAFWFKTGSGTTNTGWEQRL